MLGTYKYKGQTRFKYAVNSPRTLPLDLVQVHQNGRRWCRVSKRGEKIVLTKSYSAMVLSRYRTRNGERWNYKAVVRLLEGPYEGHEYSINL